MEDDLLLLCGDNGVLLGEADGLTKQLFRYAWIKDVTSNFINRLPVLEMEENQSSTSLVLRHCWC